MTTNSTINRSGALVTLPFLRRLALCRPGVDGSDFGLESRVDKSMAFEGVEALELGRDNDGSESLTAAA